MQPNMSVNPPRVKIRKQRTGSDAVSFWFDRIQRNITDRPGRSLSVVLAVAVGVSIAIAIIAASDGIDQKIRSLLDNQNQDALSSAGIDIGTIHSVLQETRDLLTKLAIGFTTALVGLVTWVTMGQRRREIGINLQQGMHREEVIGELLGESFILCVAGGVAGIVLGLILCNLIGSQLPLLPMQPDMSGVIAIFPTTTMLSFGATAAIATFFTKLRDTKVNL